MRGLFGVVQKTRWTPPVRVPDMTPEVATVRMWTLLAFTEIRHCRGHHTGATDKESGIFLYAWPLQFIQKAPNTDAAMYHPPHSTNYRYSGGAEDSGGWAEIDKTHIPW